MVALYLKEGTLMTATVAVIGPRPRGGDAFGSSARPSSRDDRRVAGKALRDRVPRRQISEWAAPKNRRHPVDMVIESSKGRIPELI